MKNMSNIQKIESKNIFSSLQTSTQYNARKETTHYYYSFFEGYGLERRLNTSPTPGNRLDFVSFCTVGNAVGEEKLSLRTSEDQVEVGYKIL